MTWEYIKDKVLVFGEYDYTSISLVTAIVSEFDDVVNNTDAKIYTCKLIKELLLEDFIEVYYVEAKELLKLQFNTDEEIDNIVSLINESFDLYISSNEKGIKHIRRNDNKGW